GFLAVLEGNRRYLIGTLSGTTSPGVWRSLTGLQPPSTFQDLEVSVESTSQAAEVLEIQVIGTALGGG
ncbi:MAG TPA: hypothetical protein VK194_02240, partial [Candidatus Deferrimicrobium sp.]|nr:hypothetical protein [Candidatus Deferrimicrobium sp.]